jgi:Right handed beta helix region
MVRLRTLVAAGWVVATIAGSTAVGAGAEPVASAQDVGAIDATGATDVTAELQALFDRTPNGGIVRLARDGDYRVEGTIMLNDRHNLLIDGNGARIFATTTGEPGRNQIQIRGGSWIEIRNLEIQGAHPHGGLDGYVPELEFQAAITIAGVTDIELDRVNIHDTYGDNIFIDRLKEKGDRDTVGVWIHDSTFARTGRQGIAVIDGRDIVIERNRFVDMARGTVDLEPLGELAVENVHIIDNHVGPGQLLFVPMAGGAPVNRVVIARNTLRGRVLSVSAKTPEGQRRRQFWVVDNTSDAPATGPPVEFFRVDGAVVHGNRQPITRQGEALVMTADTCDVVVADNNAAPGTRQLEGDNRACGRSISLAPPAPPAVAGRGQAERTSPPPAASPPATATPTTAAPSTTSSTQAPPASSTTAPASSTAPTLSALTVDTESPDDGVATPVVILAVVLLALVGVGGTLAFTAWRGRR